ncbi:hypothetical protein [Cellulosimicrobium sp. Marseille-Q4280]|uniref:hypothetical protein n=1 Tax=Cellulosimicrobium sp. Marseille-Q4280 TaxID=2937992 RepID=UPI002041DBBD|nr:hypothetical protein [Cellulosimicrobium sp. Marseille-Q4280]
MSTNPNRVPAGVSTGGQFATGARAESEASLTAAEQTPARLRDRYPVVTGGLHVTVADPDDPQGMPAYDGDAEVANERLAPGYYVANTEDGQTVTLHVPAPDDQIEWDNIVDADGAPTMFAEVDGMPVHVTFLPGTFDGADVRVGGQLVGEAFEDSETGKWHTRSTATSLSGYLDDLDAAARWHVERATPITWETTENGPLGALTGTVHGTPVRGVYETDSGQEFRIDLFSGKDQLGQVYYEQSEGGWRAFVAGEGVKPAATGLASRDVAIRHVVDGRQAT